jgi:hypothetical protein
VSTPVAIACAVVFFFGLTMAQFRGNARSIGIFLMIMTLLVVLGALFITNIIKIT